LPKYIALLNWTDQGVRAVKDTPKRAENAKALARKLGGKLDMHYTMGEYDAVAIIEMPSDEAYNRFALSTAMLGNIRTKTMKAWTLEEFQKVVDQLP
jgi:uncharacterized protein with GYD domain